MKTEPNIEPLTNEFISVMGELLDDTYLKSKYVENDLPIENPKTSYKLRSRRKESAELSPILEYKLKALMHRNMWNTLQVRSKKLNQRIGKQAPTHRNKHSKFAVIETICNEDNDKHPRPLNKHLQHFSDKEQHKKKNTYNNDKCQLMSQMVDNFKNWKTNSMHALRTITTKIAKTSSSSTIDELPRVPENMNFLFLENLLNDSDNQSLNLLIDVRNLKMQKFCTNLRRISEEPTEEVVTLEHRRFGLIGNVMSFFSGAHNIMALFLFRPLPFKELNGVVYTVEEVILSTGKTFSKFWFTRLVLSVFHEFHHLSFSS